MDVAEFCRQSRVVVVVGKGGVGKTTVAAALAATAASAGLDVLLASLEESPAVATMFDRREPVGYDEVVLSPGVESPSEESQKSATTRVPGRIRTRVLGADFALLDYLSSHGLGRVARRLVRSGALDVITTAVPGVREVLVLGKLKQLERDGVADLIVLDAPASGHAVSFLTSSSGLFDAARSGPLHSQAEQVVELLRDGERCRVVLVTIPEETPVSETVETAFRLEEEVGVSLGPIVVNNCYPIFFAGETSLDDRRNDEGVFDRPSRERAVDAAIFRRSRQAIQRLEIERLAHAIPLPQLQLPHLFRTELAEHELALLSASLSTAIGEL